MDKKRPFYIPARFVLAFMGHCGILVAYTMRVNLSVGLVAMVNSTYINEHSHHKLDPECARSGGSNTTSASNVGEFEWDENTQGVILGAFFYGYLVTQLPGGLVATHFGGKWVFGIGILITSVLTVLTPVVARLNVKLFIALRVLEGLGEGVTFPAMHAMLSRWSPIFERSKLATLVYSGAAMGTLIALPISGVLCYGTFLGGWPSVFYIFGGLGIVWFILWAFLITSSPESHPRISKDELDFIVSQRGGKSNKKEKLKIPWMKIFTSMPLWAIFVANICNNWTFYTFLTSLPLYFKEVLNFPIQQNGFLSGLPFLVALFVQIGSGQIADYFRYRRILSTTVVRKILSSTGFFVPAGLLVVTSYMGCSQIPAAVALMALSVGILACNNAAYSINHLDIAPNFAGVLQGITNSAGTVPGFVAPLLVGILTEDEPTREQWQKVLFIAAGICTVGGLFFLVFASGAEQAWNKLPVSLTTDENSEPINGDSRSSICDEDDALITA